jgi:hypothetical protein
VRALYLVLLAAACSYTPSRLDNGDDVLPAPTDGTVESDAPVAPIDAAIDAPPPDPVTVDLPVTADTYVDSLNQSTTFGAQGVMLVDGGGTPATALWRVDLSSVPATATVTAAELHIVVANDTGNSSFVFEMLESWSEANATWNRRDTDVSWSGQGASPPSRGQTAIGGPVLGFPSGNLNVVPISLEIVNKWVQTPATNFGAAMVMGNSDGTNYRTRNDSTVGRRPFLRITYQP